MFIKNKYYTWYYNIVKTAQNRPALSGYVEHHHIIPRCIGGTDENIVPLTAREHFILHILLTKFTSGQSYYKMLYAAVGMRRARNYQDRYINSRLYETIKK